jgi:chlorobactene glucosyltransferase
VTAPLVPLLATLPWLLPLVASVLRSRGSRSLDTMSTEVVEPAPLVSVVIPARNEQRNIERCVRSVLSSNYPALEVIVVDDHSTDGTGDMARAIGDPRLRVINAPNLPAGWFGKQWACATGASHAAGELLLFTDADTLHGADLLPRAVNAVRERQADLFTIAGRQEMHSFWERVIQPQIFSMLSLRYGGTEFVNKAKRAEDVIANGQYLLVRRSAYDALGGHALVRDQVAEDLALGQEFFRAGRRVVMMLATEQFSTHMYASLGELVRGWRKNIYAGGRNAVWGGAAGRAVFPVLLPAVPMFGLAPPIALLLSAVGGLPAAWLIWSATIVTLSIVYWLIVYRYVEAPIPYAFLYPLGLALVAYIALGAVARGQRVEWKDRKYISS